MARPLKKGLDYFSFEVDTFNDRKIKKLLKAFSTRGFTIYTFLLCEIYKDEGYFIKYDDDLAFDVSDSFNIKENLVKEVVNFCCSVGLFNKELLTNESILTSSGIQKRYKMVTTKAKRSDAFIKKEYDLISNLRNKSEETSINSEETPFNSEFTPVNSEKSTQSKVKKSKVKERKGNGINSEKCFFEILNLYYGTKRDYDTEFNHFKKLFDDWEDILPDLLPSLKKQIEYRNYCSKNNIFVPNPKHFKNWIKERCWEETTPEIPKDDNSEYIRYGGPPKELTQTKEELELIRKFNAGEWVE